MCFPEMGGLMVCWDTATPAMLPDGTSVPVVCRVSLFTYPSPWGLSRRQKGFSRSSSLSFWSGCLTLKIRREQKMALGSRLCQSNPRQARSVTPGQESHSPGWWSQEGCRRVVLHSWCCREA